MPRKAPSRDRNVAALATRSGKGPHRNDYREKRLREEEEAAMQDVTQRQTVAKEDIIRNILDAYAKGEDGALCMNALAPLVEWLLEDHAWLQTALHEGDPDPSDFEMF